MRSHTLILRSDAQHRVSKDEGEPFTPSCFDTATRLLSMGT